MSDDWMRPITKQLPGPVGSEAMQMSVAERAQIVLTADHNDGEHDAIAEPSCRFCRKAGR